MSRRKRQADPDDDQQDQPIVPMPPFPYPLDEAIEQAHAPELDAYLPAPATTPSDSWLDDSATAADEQDGAEDGPSVATGQRHGDGTEAGPRTGPDSGTETELSTAPHTEMERTPYSPSSVARASASTVPPVAAEPPRTVAEQLAGLPRWQANYVLALMELGGNTGLAATRCRVSRESVEEHQAVSPAFAAACASAVSHSVDIMDASLYRGGSIGDLRAKYQGGRLVGYERIRSAKDAELWLRLRGMLKDEQTVTHQGRVELVPATVPTATKDGLARLMAARSGPAIDV